MSEAHYKGDVRETEIVVGRRTDGVVMVASMASYDEETDTTTITFVPEEEMSPNPSGLTWGMALAIDEDARARFHEMWPEYATGPLVTKGASRG